MNTLVTKKISDDDECEPIVIHKWSVGYSEPTSYDELLYYKKLDFHGGLSGGGESLRYTPPAKK